MTEDSSHHPRLLLLHEAGGEIQGRAKYHKLLYNYWDEESEDSSLSFIREDYGPYDPGLSRAIRRYFDLGLVDVDESEEPYTVSQTDKGRRYMSGFERTKMRLDKGFRQTRERIQNTVFKHGDKSASEMVERENIQEVKDEPFRKGLE